MPPRAQRRFAARIIALALVLVAAAVVGVRRPDPAVAGTPVHTVGGTGSCTDGCGIVISPTPLDFGVVAKNSSTTLQLGLKNTNTKIITINALNKPITTNCNPFTVTPNPSLPDAMLGGASRTWDVTFHPLQYGSYDCQFNISTDDLSNPPIHLVGNVPPPVIMVNPSPIAFGNVAVNTVADQTVTISNQGSGFLTVNQIKPATGNPPFNVTTISPQLPATIGSGSSILFTAEFSPTATGPFTGTIQINSNDPLNGNLIVNESGSGVASGGAVIDLEPSPDDLGHAPVGQRIPGSFSVGNTGNIPLVVSSMTITGATATDFSFSDGSLGCTSGQTCNASFQVNATSIPRLVNIACVPSSAGPRFATLTVTSNAQSGTNTLTLQCTGDAPAINVSPPSIEYNTVRLGTTAHANLFVSNGGTADLHVSAIPIDGVNPGDFAVTSCAGGCTIPPSTIDQIDVTFTPGARGPRSAVLHVKSDDPDDAVVDVPLSGTGGAGVMVITTPANGMINFGSIPVSTTSSSSPIVIANQGEVSLTVNTAVASPSQFGMTGPQTPVVINPNTSVQFDVTCTPSAATTYTGSAMFTSDAPVNGSQMVSLSCTGITTSLSANPAPVSFGSVRTDIPKTITVTITNNGGVASTIDHLSATPGVYTTSVQGTPLPRTLSQGQQLKVDVTFTPTASQAYPGDLTLFDSGGVTLLDDQLNGDGVVPSFDVMPSSIDYGALCVGQADLHSATITNDGTATIKLVSTALTGTGVTAFAISSGGVSSPIDLAPTQTHQVSIVGTAHAGTSTANLVVTTDLVTGGTGMVMLSITGTSSGLGSNPTSLDFGSHAIGSPVPPMTVDVINCSAQPVMITGASVAGTDHLAFAENGPTSGAMLVGGSATYTVSFAPQHGGAHAAQLVVTTDGGQVMIDLTGAGETSGGDGGTDGGLGGDGGNGLQSTSYYACSCRAGATPGGALPIAAAFALVLRRRKRR